MRTYLIDALIIAAGLLAAAIFIAAAITAYDRVHQAGKSGTSGTSLTTEAPGTQGAPGQPGQTGTATPGSSQYASQPGSAPDTVEGAPAAQTPTQPQKTVVEKVLDTIATHIVDPIANLIFPPGDTTITEGDDTPSTEASVGGSVVDITSDGITLLAALPDGTTQLTTVIITPATQVFRYIVKDPATLAAERAAWEAADEAGDPPSPFTKQTMAATDLESGMLLAITVEDGTPWGSATVDAASIGVIPDGLGPDGL